MVTPALSVVIPFHTDRVVTTLDSLSVCSDIDGCEVILVSDGVKAELLDDIVSHYSHLTLTIVPASKCGRIGHLRNLGIAEARAACCYFVDSDCSLQSDAVSRVLAAMGSSGVLKGRNVFVGTNWISRLDAQLRDERYQANPQFAYCPNVTVRREVFVWLGAFNSELTYGSDGDFAKRLAEAGIPVMYDRNIVVYHDCTSTFAGVFKKWMNYGEARYYRYRNQKVTNKVGTYFPNLFNLKRGVLYNITALLCDFGRAVGMLRGYYRIR